MTIDQFNFAGKKAIVRVDFNVPLDEKGNVTDDTRIRGALPTLKKVLADGGALIMMSHMGKPKGKVKPELSLAQIVKNVSKALGVEVKFAKDCGHADAEVAALKPGEALLLENLRFYPEEEGKPVGVEKGTPEYDQAKKEMKSRQKDFAKKLASYADCYVMDAFGTAHRRHASTAVIADYFNADNKMLGYLMEKEVKAVDAVLNNIKRPFTAIMGGSKVSTKIGIIENLLGKVDNLILCGGMTYTFAKAQGGKIGNSICENDKLDVALDVIKKAKENNVKLVPIPSLPTTSRTMPTRRFVLPIIFPTVGRVWTPVLRLVRRLPKPSRVPRPSCGTVRRACSSSIISQAVRKPSQKPLQKQPKRAHSRSSVAVIPLLVSTSSAWPIKFLTSPRAVAPCSKPLKAKFSRALQPSRANKFTSIKQENIKVGFHFLKVHFFGVIRDTTNTLEVINMWDIDEMTKA